MSENETVRDIVMAMRADVQWIKKAMEHGAERMDGHDKRLGKLERWRSLLVGGFLVLTSSWGGSHFLRVLPLATILSAFSFPVH